jgi:hypothetical protein
MKSREEIENMAGDLECELLEIGRWETEMMQQENAVSYYSAGCSPIFSIICC